MKFKSPLIAVRDMEKSKSFYRRVLGLRVVMDFGANVTLSGGIALQTIESWKDFINRTKDDITFGGNDMELSFEEDDFDDFIKRLEKMKDIEYVHHVFEHRWGQRVVRFYDPDMHIIEVGENLKSVCRRFLYSGMSVDEVAERMGVPVKFVEKSISR